MAHEITNEESEAIKALNRLAAGWPSGLWLYSANGSLCVMKKTAAGARATTRDGGFDPSFCVDTIAIENDGGDW